MLISDLVTLLNNLREKHGNVEICGGDVLGYYSLDIVKYVEEEDKIFFGVNE